MLAESNIMSGGGGLQYGNGIILDESTNILVNTFRDAFLRLNPDSKDKW